MNGFSLIYLTLVCRFSKELFSPSQKNKLHENRETRDARSDNSFRWKALFQRDKKIQSESFKEQATISNLWHKPGESFGGMMENVNLEERKVSFGLITS